MPVAMPTEPIAVRIREAALLLGISRSHAYRLVEDGQMPGAYKMGGRWLIHLDTLRKAMAERVS